MIKQNQLVVLIVKISEFHFFVSFPFILLYSPLYGGGLTVYYSLFLSFLAYLYIHRIYSAIG